MFNMYVTHIVTAGKSIQSATVHNVEATDILQAELKAERFLNYIAKESGEVVSTDRWELVEAIGNRYTIKFL